MLLNGRNGAAFGLRVDDTALALVTAGMNSAASGSKVKGVEITETSQTCAVRTETDTVNVTDGEENAVDVGLERMRNTF
jgi:hypothetical protein